MGKKHKKYSVKGIFPYEDEPAKKSKKERREEQKRLLREQDKKMSKMAKCNHLDSKKNKPHFKNSEDGNYRICKICGGRLINNPDLFSKDIVESSAEALYTLFSLVRNRLGVDEETDKLFVKVNQVILKAPHLYDMLSEDSKEQLEHKKKKKDGKKKKKKNNKNFSRIDY